METELKYFSDEGLEYLLNKNEENIEAMKEVHVAIIREIERRNTYGIDSNFAGRSPQAENV